MQHTPHVCEEFNKTITESNVVVGICWGDAHVTCPSLPVGLGENGEKKRKEGLSVFLLPFITEYWRRWRCC
jgi:hypothetical protein